MDLTKIVAYVAEGVLILAGFYFATRGWKTARLPELTIKQAAKAGFFFSIFLVFVSLGFMFIIMTTDGTLSGESLLAILLIGLMVGAVMFIFFFVGSLLVYRFIRSTRKILETKRSS